jgi:hypothetical protein
MGEPPLSLIVPHFDGSDATPAAASGLTEEESTMTTTYKSKDSARKAARKAMGPEAIEGVDFNIKGANNGWIVEAVPPANEGAAQAQATRGLVKVIRAENPAVVISMPLAEAQGLGLMQAQDVGSNEVWTDATNPLLVGAILYPNKTRASDARRALAAREAAANAPAPMAAAADAAKQSVAVKRASRKDVAAAKAKPKPAAKAKKAPKAKAAKQRPSAPEGQTKSEMIIGMLSTSGGATSREMETATGWAPHSVRGFLGTLRAKGVNVVAKKLPKEPTIYRIAKAKAAPKAQAEAVGDVI